MNLQCMYIELACLASMYRSPLYIIQYIVICFYDGESVSLLLIANKTFLGCSNLSYIKTVMNAHQVTGACAAIVMLNLHLESIIWRPSLLRHHTCLLKSRVMYADRLHI